MAKGNKRNSFGWGLLIGIIIAAGAVYYYQNYYKKSDIEKNTQRLENKAKKGINKAEKEVKKIFDK
jgi:hypothetical protein